MLFLQILTGSKGGSLGSKMGEGEVGGEAAATGISVHSFAGAACVDMAAERHTVSNNSVFKVVPFLPFYLQMTVNSVLIFYRN